MIITTVLTTELTQKLESLKLTKIKYRRAVAFIDLLINRIVTANNIYRWHSLSQKYLMSMLGGTRYLETLSPLKEAGIVEQSDSYKIGAYSKSYRLDPKLLNLDFKALFYEEKVSDDSCLLTVQDRNIILKDLSKLKLDSDIIYAVDIAVEEHLSKSISTEVIGNNLTVRFQEGGKGYFYTAAKAKEFAGNENLDLFRYKQNYYIMDKAQFIRQKKSDLKFIYTYTYNKIQSQAFRAKRNSTNRRIDTNLTSLPTFILDYITVNGENLSSIDLKNSQLTIFSAILKNPSLFKDKRASFFASYEYDDTTYAFIRECEAGTIYEAVAGKLFEGLECSNDLRKVAKNTVFEVIFSSEKNNSPAKQTIKDMYPQVIEMMDAFKKEYGYENFSVLLQTIESEIFIDDIYQELKRQGLTVYTKHDSVLVKQSEKKTAHILMKQSLDMYQMGYRLSIEDYGNKIHLRDKRASKSLKMAA